MLISKTTLISQKQAELNQLIHMLNSLEVNDSNKQRIEQLKISISLHKKSIEKLDK